MKAIYALYSDPSSAQRAVDALRRQDAGLGVKPQNIAIISSEPFEEYEFGRGVNRKDHRSVMPWISALGGVMGGAAGFWLAAFTQNAYPLPTGGMAIVPLWTNGIITYETTMLGAILATLLTLLITTRLPDPRRKLYDPAVSDGRILVGVLDPPESSRGALEKAMREAGTEEIVSSIT